MNKHLGAAAVLVVLLVLIFGCSHSSKPSVNTSNPASEYCLSLGGELAIKSAKEGEVGVCKLPSGEIIEEWLLYRREH